LSYRKRHPEKARLNDKRYREKHRAQRLEYFTQYRATHQKEIKEYYEKRKDFFQEYQRKYWQNHKEESNKHTQKYRDRHPEVINAERLAHRLVPLDKQCKICGSTENLQRHHPDYSKPLEVVTLCRTCHLGKAWLLEALG